MKPEESLAHHGSLVAANYRPTGMKPVVAKHRKKCFTAFPPRDDKRLMTRVSAVRTRVMVSIPRVELGGIAMPSALRRGFMIVGQGQVVEVGRRPHHPEHQDRLVRHRHYPVHRLVRHHLVRRLQVHDLHR